MADSKFWRTLAVTFVAGVFYLAHGLHDPASVGSIPSLGRTDIPIMSVMSAASQMKPAKFAGSFS